MSKAEYMVTSENITTKDLWYQFRSLERLIETVETKHFCSDRFHDRMKRTTELYYFVVMRELIMRRSGFRVG